VFDILNIEKKLFIVHALLALL